MAIGLVTTSALDARADDEPAEGGATPSDKARSEEERHALYEALSAPRSGYVRVLFGIGFGGGLRLNNPYRLASQLGQTAESASATAPYTMISAGLAFGRPDGLQHGAFIGTSFALTGVSQSVLVPAYMLVYRGPRRVLGYGRAGPAIVLSPDTNVGGEIALGGAFFLTGGLGVSLDVAGDVFYGASTWQKKYPTYPVLSATLGLIMDLEILP